MLLYLLREVAPDASSPDLLMAIIGVIAATMTTSSFLPQMIKAYRTKSMGDVSPYLMAVFGTGTMFWLAYGIFKNDWVIIGANALGTTFNMILLYMKFAYKKKSTKIA
jgi:MtN3 and saliva related transmembrane protein